MRCSITPGSLFLPSSCHSSSLTATPYQQVSISINMNSFCLKLYFITMDLNGVHSIVSILISITLSYLYSSILVHVSVVYSLYCYFIYVDLFIHYLFIHLPADGYLGYLKFCIFLINLWTFEYKFCVCICFYLGKYLEVGFLDKHIANFWKTAEGFFKEVIPLAI